jgi:hypothetical protein
MTPVRRDDNNAKRGSRKPQRFVSASACSGLRVDPFEFHRSEALALRVAVF